MKSLGQIGNILKGFDLYVPPKKQTRQIVEYTDLHEWKRQSLLMGKILYWKILTSLCRRKYYFTLNLVSFSIFWQQFIFFISTFLLTYLANFSAKVFTLLYIYRNYLLGIPDLYQLLEITLCGVGGRAGGRSSNILSLWFSSYFLTNKSLTVLCSKTL